MKEAPRKRRRREDKQHHPKVRGEGTTKEAENEVPPEGRLGKQHHPHADKGESSTTQKNAGSEQQNPKTGDGEGTTAQTEEVKEKFTSPFWWCSLPSPPQGGRAFPLSPLGGADFPPLP